MRAIKHFARTVLLLLVAVAVFLLVAKPAFSQTGAVNVSTLRSTVADSTTVTGSTAYGLLYYNHQKQEWRFRDATGTFNPRTPAVNLTGYLKGGVINNTTGSFTVIRPSADNTQIFSIGTTANRYSTMSLSGRSTSIVGYDGSLNKSALSAEPDSLFISSNNGTDSTYLRLNATLWPGYAAKFNDRLAVYSLSNLTGGSTRVYDWPDFSGGSLVSGGFNYLAGHTYFGGAGYGGGPTGVYDFKIGSLFNNVRDFEVHAQEESSINGGGGAFTIGLTTVNGVTMGSAGHGVVADATGLKLVSSGSPTTGTLLYQNSSGYFVPRNPTVNGYVLTLVSGEPNWAAVTGGVTSVSGTAGRITSTGGTTPVIDFSATLEALISKRADRIDQNNAATTSAQFLSVISDETGTGSVVGSASPALTGTPTAPTAAGGTNTTQIANTAHLVANYQPIDAGLIALAALDVSGNNGKKIEISGGAYVASTQTLNPITTDYDLLTQISGVLARFPKGSDGQFLGMSAGAFSWATPAGGSALSSITAATTTNTINNGASLQEWQWNTLAGTSAFKLSSTSTAATGNANAVFNVSTSGANSTSTQTTYGGIFRNTKTGTSSTNIAGSFGASGGTTNIALEISSGSIRTPFTSGQQLALINSSGDVTVDPTLLWATQSLTVGNGSSAPLFIANYATTAGGGGLRMISGSTATFQIGGNSLGTYGGSANNINGASFSVFDNQASASRLGVGPTGTLFVGPSSSSFGVSMTQAGAITAITSATIGGNSTAAGFTNVLEDTDNGSNKVVVAAPASLAGDTRFQYPGTNGTSGWALITDGSGNTSWSAMAGIGGSLGATDNAVPRADGTGGTTLQSSALIIEDTGILKLAGANTGIETPGGGSAIYLNDGSGIVSIGPVGLADYTYFNGHAINSGGSAADIPITLISKGTSGVDIKGTATNNTAASGYVGEPMISTQSTYTNYTTTATYQNIVSITLTAGDWDLDAFFTYSSNSATITAAANAIFAVSTTTASASGATEGLNISYVPQAALLGTSRFSDAIPTYRVSISGSTTYYLNTQATFTLGNPQFVGSIIARRIR